MDSPKSELTIQEVVAKKDAALKEVTHGLIGLISVYASLLDSPDSFRSWLARELPAIRETTKKGLEALELKYPDTTTVK